MGVRYQSIIHTRQVRHKSDNILKTCRFGPNPANTPHMLIQLVLRFPAKASTNLPNLSNGTREL